MTQPANYPPKFIIESTPTTHSFQQETLEINSETRLRELMEYNANRITRETIDKISTVLAEEWLVRYKKTWQRIDAKEIAAAVERKIQMMTDDDDHNLFPTGIGRD